MRESYRKGLANHPDPESGVVSGREAAIEALTVAHAGRVLSCFITHHQDADGVHMPEGNIRRDAAEPCAVGDPEHVWKLSTRENRETPGILAASDRRRVGRRRPCAVRPPCTSLGSRTVV